MQIRQAGCWARGLKQVHLAALLGLCTPVALAQSACPAPAQWQAASLDQLSRWREVCDEDAFFQAHLGAMLLAHGHTEAAAVVLEKALLTHPDLPGAQLDYAHALAQMGLPGSAWAMVSEVMQRPDIQPELKARLASAHDAAPPAPTSTPTSNVAAWVPTPAVRWNGLVQTLYGHESNLNSATYTDALTLYLSNGPVTLGLANNAKPVAGSALKTTAVAQAVWGGAGGQEFAVNLALTSKTGAASVGGNNLSTDGALKYSRPMLAGAASGLWQLAAGGTQFWLGHQTAYTDQGLQLKFAWDSLGAACKSAPAMGRIEQSFPMSRSLNGVYSFGRISWVCNSGNHQNTQIDLGGGHDVAQDASRPGGNRNRADLLVRHEQTLALPWLSASSGQMSAWLRLAHSQDKLAYSDLLGDLKSNTRRTDWGLAYWGHIAKHWSAGINLETTLQKSNNTLFNLKNSSLYLGIRWENG